MENQGDGYFRWWENHNSTQRIAVVHNESQAVQGTSDSITVMQSDDNSRSDSLSTSSKSAAKDKLTLRSEISVEETSGEDVDATKDATEGNIGFEENSNSNDTSCTENSHKKRTRKNTNNPLTRKRKINKSVWLDFQAKKSENSGVDGVSRKGTTMKARKMGDGCKQNCRFKCHERVTFEDRQKAFSDFWKLGDHTRQWDCIAQWVTSARPAEKTATSDSEDDRANKKKAVVHQFSLPQNTSKIKVCRTMFLSTLDISYQWVRTVTKKLGDSNMNFVEQPDQRGKHQNRPHKVQESVTNTARNHINSFPIMASHYCRENSERKYLEEGLNMSLMYRLYVERMLQIGVKDIVHEKMYRDIFKYEYNLGFFHPKKDRCDQCEAFSNRSEKERAEYQETYDGHIKNKKIARKLMKEDKEKAKKDTKLCVANIDMQKVLTTPRTQISSLYYMSKLSVWNFTIFDMATHTGICNVWNESIGYRGANEIASHLRKFIIEKANAGVREFIFYSDNCGGQNRNKIVFTMYIMMCRNFGVNITHRFLEVGHTQNDGDSMHARIEIHCRNKTIFTQQQWCKLMSEAKTDNPYLVNEIKQCRILDFTHLASIFNWPAVKIASVREINVCSNRDDISVKYNFDEIEKRLVILKKKYSWNYFDEHEVPQAYDFKLKLNDKKKSGLQSMCDRRLIPSEFHDFYDDIIE